MEDKLNAKLQAYMQNKCITAYDIAKNCDLTYSTLQRQLKGETAMSAKVLEAILGYCQDLSAEWLLRGKGEMLISQQGPAVVYNVQTQQGDGVNVGRDYNPGMDNSMLQFLMQQNQELMRMLAEKGGK